MPLKNKNDKILTFEEKISYYRYLNSYGKAINTNKKREPKLKTIDDITVTLISPELIKKKSRENIPPRDDIDHLKIAKSSLNSMLYG